MCEKVDRGETREADWPVKKHHGDGAGAAVPLWEGARRGRSSCAHDDMMTSLRQTRAWGLASWTQVQGWWKQAGDEAGVHPCKGEAPCRDGWVPNPVEPNMSQHVTRGGKPRTGARMGPPGGPRRGTPRAAGRSRGQGTGGCTLPRFTEMWAGENQN